MTAMSIPFEIFRRSNAQITSFYMQNIVHAVVIVEGCARTRNTRSCFDCDETWPAISFPFEIFRRLNEIITGFYVQNTVHADSCVETSRTQQAKRENSTIWTINDRNFLPVFDISSCKRPHYCILLAEHSPRRIMLRHKPINSQNALILRLWRTISVATFPLEIFPRLIAQITAIHTQNTVHAVLSFETSQKQYAKRYHSSIWTKDNRNFRPAWDISAFKRPH
jgi:hypothetical protein